ncbi:MAG: hypothetical protein Q8N36_03215 [bacterium]|nr:hypothetical protein [bacterium]
MDAKRRARQLRAIIQLGNALEGKGIVAWLGGGWALEALDPTYQREHVDIDFCIMAEHASDVRVLLEEDGYDIVSFNENSFRAERGKSAIDWELLWSDEFGKLVSYYPNREQPYEWPVDAFPDKKNGILDGTPVYAMSAASQQRHKLEYSKDQAPLREKDIKDLSRLKAIIHDRM